MLGTGLVLSLGERTRQGVDGVADGDCARAVVRDVEQVEAVVIGQAVGVGVGAGQKGEAVLEAAGEEPAHAVHRVWKKEERERRRWVRLS